MPETILTESDIARGMRGYYDRNFLSNSRPYLIYRQFGQDKRLPKKSSRTIYFRRVSTLPKATTPLTEGVTPSGSSFSITEVSATVKQYGDYVRFSDQVDLTSEDPILTKISAEQGEQAGQTHDQLTKDVLVAGTNVSYANGVSRSQVNSELSKGDIDSAARFFRSQNARPITSRIKPGPEYKTEAVNPSYFGIIHQDTIPTIEAMTGFINVKDYPDPKAIMENEIGAVGSIRFVWTSEAKVWSGAGAAGGANVKETTGNADIYATLVLARDAFGIIHLDGGSMQFIVKQVGSAGAADPLNQSGTMGWKSWDATKILNEAFIMRIEHANKNTL